MAPAPLFDTLRYANELEQVGIPTEQAKTQVRLLSGILEANVCTKQDLSQTESSLKQDLLLTEANLKQAISNALSYIQQVLL